MMGHGAGHADGARHARRAATAARTRSGPEIFQALGVLRTEELLAVHRFDGAEQYFTRAIDFGFSFSVEESIEKWGHDEIVGDFVRHIRATRPDVIAGFLCGGDGGGQHHQASTRLTRRGVPRRGRSVAISRADPRRPAPVAGAARVLHREGFAPGDSRPPRTRATC